MAAKRKRNETGLLLAAGETYTARYVEHHGWKDGSYDAKPTGVDFDCPLDSLAWLVERFRPYPEGAWFQLVGGVHGTCVVFPVLGTEDSSIPNEFTAAADGELLFMVNDVYYRNNSGTMTIEISTSRQSPTR